MRARFGYRSLHTKLVLFILIFLVVPFLLIGNYWYTKFTDTIEANVIQSSKQLIEQIHDRLNESFVDLEKTTSPVLIAPLAQQFLELDGDSVYEHYKLSQRIEKELFSSIVHNRNDIAGLSLVRNDGMTITNFSKQSALTGFETYKDSLHRNTYSDRNFKIEGVRSFDRIPLLTITRNLNHLSKDDRNALFIIDLNFATLAKILEKTKPSEEGFMWLLDADNRIVYHPDANRQGQRIDLSDIARMKDLQEDYTISRNNKDKTLIVYRKSEVTGWLLIAEVPLREPLKELVNLRNITIVTGLLIVVFILVAFGGFTLSLTHSINVLKRLMKRAELGDMNVRAPEHGTVEILSLNNSFNKMVAEIKRLVEIVHVAELKEKEMEIRQIESVLHAMQSQINPHFLYNTLEMVGSMAMQAGYRPINEMLHAIAKMFRYNVRNPQEIVNLESEIEHTAIYLDIQKARFPDLTIEMQLVHAEIRHIRTVRICIQPLIENVFIHGYDKHGRRPIYIGIFGTKTDNAYVLRIEDKGGGMPKEKRDELNDAFQHMTIKDIVKDNPFMTQSIGLWNVHSRIRMTFDKPYGLFIASSDANGTVLEVILPLSDDSD